MWIQLIRMQIRIFPRSLRPLVVRGFTYSLVNEVLVQMIDSGIEHTMYYIILYTSDLGCDHPHFKCPLLVFPDIHVSNKSCH